MTSGLTKKEFERLERTLIAETITSESEVDEYFDVFLASKKERIDATPKGGLFDEVQKGLGRRQKAGELTESSDAGKARVRSKLSAAWRTTDSENDLLESRSAGGASVFGIPLAELAEIARR